MTAIPSERPYTLDEIIRQAETLGADDRLAFLNQACADDKLLLAQAVAHLRQSSPQWWDHSIESHAFDPLLTSLERTGELIGPYRVIRAIGQGGMGDVVLAERDDNQFRQQVAIKLVKRGTLSNSVQGRLKAERQILATLDHPNIASLLDGGTTTEGTPYIVMEYIDGEPIDSYCDSRKLSVAARLELFRTVCSAVHCAHQNLIVHRDLKPSNILVTNDGTPKLLDFGIAKILDVRQTMHTIALTQLDVRVMTPEHASPEQIRGEPITTASDIYALGVLLYELLTGRKPYEIKSTRLSEIENLICEQEPQPLHIAVTSQGKLTSEAIAKLCDSRSTSLPRLRRELTGDLAQIVMTALRKEPERRYPSVEQFSTDIERYLTGMPVAACKDSWQYRAKKFTRRHRVAVAFTAVAVISLAIFAVTTALQARRIAREQARAERISSFLVDMFQQADPSHSRGKEITVREMLDSGSSMIARGLEDQPDIRASLLATVGKVYSDLGIYDRSEQMLREALAVRLKLYGPHHPETADAMLKLGDTLLSNGNLENAEPLISNALQIYQRTFGADSVKFAATLRSLGILRRGQQQLDDAEKQLRESLRILSVRKTAPYTETVLTLNSLAILLEGRGDLGGAEDLYRRSLALYEQSLGPDHPEIAYTLQNLAVAIQKQGRLTEADPLFQRSLSLYRKLFGVENPETLAALANYGMFLLRKGDLDNAEQVLREVLALDRKVRGEQHSYVGYDHVNLGLLLHDKKSFPLAEAEFRAALDVYAKSIAPDHQYVGAARRSLAITLIAMKRNKEAEQELKRAIEIFKTSLPDSSPQIATTKGALGMALAAQKRFAEAEPLLLDNYRLLLAARGETNPGVVRMHGWIETFYRDLNKPEQAQQFFASLPSTK